MIIKYHGEAVDFQEAPPCSSALWGETSTWSPGPELQEAADGVVYSHLNEAQRERLAALESSGSSDEDGANGEGVAARGRGTKGKPLRHRLYRMPTQVQQARWEAVQQAREQGLFLRAIARNLGMAKNTVKKYASAASPPTKELSAIERAKADALAGSMTAGE